MVKESGSEGIRALLDQRLHMLGEEPLGLLASLPHVQDPEHAGLVVEPGGVHDQPVEGPVTHLVGHEVVVLCRAIRDRELLNVDDCHRFLLVDGFADRTPFADHDPFAMGCQLMVVARAWPAGRAPPAGARTGCDQ